ncbi:PLDc N-terminal domain-containing protein [Nesterenkonia ebinurensis]|uniref:PLDc N-terminal domain-containing protein n=1 Tax=Nesterenkonia ebinurensis TaxID=2608252 RepID=UPI00123E100B|nr:PLDc N-terminal domain-containing protein [Nesterenkonia ebinurensis]
MEIFAVLVSALIGLAYIAFAIAAILSILNSRSYTSGLKALWVLAVLAFPFLGSLVWFLVGRNSSG